MQSAPHGASVSDKCLAADSCVHPKLEEILGKSWHLTGTLNTQDPLHSKSERPHEAPEQPEWEEDLLGQGCGKVSHPLDHCLFRGDTSHNTEVQQKYGK